MTARRQTALLGVAAALALVAGGCGDEEGSAPDDAESMNGEPVAVEISEFEYLPETVTVPVGGEVTWTNSDKAAHTATADDGSFDTDTLRLDGTETVVYDEAGTFAYYCRFHAFMKGTVEVEG